LIDLACFYLISAPKFGYIYIPLFLGKGGDKFELISPDIQNYLCEGMKARYLTLYTFTPCVGSEVK
jgi:hypothetical protein